MKSNWRNSKSTIGKWAAVFLLLFVAVSCKRNEQANGDTYTCPMHPTVISDKPGTCPVCGMDLVRKARPGEEAGVTKATERLTKSPNKVVITSIKTIRGEFKTVPIAVEVVGIATYDTRYIYIISAKIGGRLDKVYVKYDFQTIRKGQKVADIYSPELLTAQRELLFLIEKDSANSDLIESAKSKLYLLGASMQQIDALIKRKEPELLFSIYSPYDGYTIPGDQPGPVAARLNAAASAPSSMGRESMPSTSSAGVQQTLTGSSAELMREGNYVTRGQTLFRVVNPTALRIELDLAISKAGSIKVNDEVEIDLGVGNTQRSKVDFIQPFFAAGEEFVKLRVYLTNQNIRIGQLITAVVHLKAVEAIWIPKEAVLDLGLKNIVFIKVNGSFSAKVVKTGIRTDGLIEIREGLVASDLIAADAHYLVDSESFTKTN